MGTRDPRVDPRGLFYDFLASWNFTAATLLRDWHSCLLLVSTFIRHPARHKREQGRDKRELLLPQKFT